MRLQLLHIETVVVALALAACEFPTKVGDLQETDTGGGQTGTGAEPTTGGDTPGATGPGGETSTTGATGTGGADTSTSGGTDPGDVETATSGATDPGGSESGTSIDCGGLDEASCAATPGCKAIRGNPYLLAGGGACVDDQTFVFLACDVDGEACPPFVPTVCPEGQVMPKFDVPSGCIPPGFEPCGEGGSPPCP